jgi:hypothetical protein
MMRAGTYGGLRMKRIESGEKPSEVFKALLRDKPALSNGDIALAFRKQFPSCGIEAMEVIWKWRRPDAKVGLSDEGLDKQLTYWLQQTGYLR